VYYFEKKYNSKQKYILFVEPFGHRDGHFSVYPNYMSKVMLDAKWNVSILTFDGMQGGWLEKEPLIKHYTVCNQFVIGKILRAIIKMMRFLMPLRPFAIGFECFLTYSAAFLRNRKQKYDIIHILDTAAPSLFFLNFAAVIKGCHLVCTLHGPSKRQEIKEWKKNFNTAFKRLDYLYCFYLLTLKISESPLIDKLWNILYSRSMKRNKIGFICLSEDTKKTYKHTIFYNEIIYIPDARPKPSLIQSSEAKSHLGLPQNTLIFLSFGINHNTKCYEVIFKAFKNLNYDFILLFAGKILTDSPATNDPRRLAEKYQLVDKTIINDHYISDDEMAYYFCAADAFLLSYRDVPIDASGGFSFAYQCGLPSISVNIGRMGEMVNNNNLGFTFIPEDEKSLRNAILNFINLNDKEKLALRQHIIKYAESSNSWEDMTARYLHFYHSLISKKWTNTFE
jgi:glycosyltransferase involved in cell wall biosynthesis